METYTVRDLRDRTGELIKGAEAGHLALMTKHGRPVIVALPFDQKLLEQGVMVSLAVRLFDEGVVTQGQAAKLAGLSLAEFFAACASHQVPVVRYEAGELDVELKAFDADHRRR
ncbi:type II toxin-antitoxin system prevent-host-death family antitoxin [Pseudomarimonas arenosa]|uniref:Type II toxin-antitoxin system prevent-host-death family antitoxin n=1 Tax=Pseudomarimonas arenosa TaxID=2774145 RepID=A0AAW3ZIT3_9GAMM|nr:type II toxin-antitoxin system prevent-host-death family antitoxin [Pseudomarimonas arenosa]MBD8525975.1 type II toxin-antitoxin system prevent-host-death family antitoxin [Pseudomarimonas arenosa]